MFCYYLLQTPKEKIIVPIVPLVRKNLSQYSWGILRQMIVFGGLRVLGFRRSRAEPKRAHKAA